MFFRVNTLLTGLIVATILVALLTYLYFPCQCPSHQADRRDTEAPEAGETPAVSMPFSPG